MELSTSIPIPSISPDMDMMFKEIPVKYISTTAVTTESGMEQAITKVGLISFKNKSRTKMARIAPKIIFCITLFTIMSIYTP